VQQQQVQQQQVQQMQQMQQRQVLPCHQPLSSSQPSWQPAALGAYPSAYHESVLVWHLDYPS
jgi:hypothetical protein